MAAMKRLLLLRHAKSAWDDADLDDFDRPLAPRGIKASKKIGKLLRDDGLRPARALCSTAVRAKATWALVTEAMGGEVETEFRQDLYLAEPKAMLAAIAGVPDGCGTMIVIGHNPGMEKLTVALAASGAEKAIEDFQGGFPSAGLAVIEFDVERWAAVSPGSGRLARFVRPRTL